MLRSCGKRAEQLGVAELDALLGQRNDDRLGRLREQQPRIEFLDTPSQAPGRLVPIATDCGQHAARVQGFFAG